MSYESPSEGTTAKYNAGVLGTERLDKTLTLLNFSKINPTAWNNDHMEYNFLLTVQCINVIYHEIDSYVSDTERELCLKIAEKIDELVEKYPIYERSKKPNLENWKRIKKAIDYYERKVKQLAFKYHIISAPKEEAGRI